jgi:hypothetical protein
MSPGVDWSKYNQADFEGLSPEELDHLKAVRIQELSAPLGVEVPGGTAEQIAGGRIDELPDTGGMLTELADATGLSGITDIWSLITGGHEFGEASPSQARILDRQRFAPHATAKNMLQWETDSPFRADLYQELSEVPEVIGDLVAFMPMGRGAQLASKVGGPLLKTGIRAGYDALFGAAAEETGDALTSLIQGREGPSLGGFVEDVAVNTGLGVIGEGVMRAGGGVLNKVGTRMTDVVDVPTNARAAMKVNPYPGSGIDDQHLDLVLDRLDKQPVFQNLDQLVNEKKPFDTLRTTANAEIERVGTELDAEALKAQYRFGDVWDMGRVPGQPIAREQTAAGRAFRQERNRMAEKALGPDGVRVYEEAQSRLAATEKELAGSTLPDPAKVAPYGPRSDGIQGPSPVLIDKRNQLQQIVDSFDQQINKEMDSVANLRGARKRYDVLSKFEDPTMAPVQKSIANALRDAEENAIRQQLGDEAGNAYVAGKRYESDLLRISPGLEAGGRIDLGLPPGPELAGQLGSGGGKFYANKHFFGFGGPKELQKSALRRGFAPSGMDRFMGIAGNALQGPSKAMQGNSLSGILAGSAAMQDDPNQAKLPVVQSEAASVQYFATPKQGFTIPRNLAAIDIDAMANLIAHKAPVEAAVPLIQQLRRIQAGGDKRELAEYLTTVIGFMPDLPLQVGAVTGLKTEFDLGDGVARLFGEEDKMKYEKQIDSSNLDAIEKALRVQRVRTTGQVHRFDETLNTSRDAKVSTGIDHAKKTHQFAPRVPTPMGSRKVQY